MSIEFEKLRYKCNFCGKIFKRCSYCAKHIEKHSALGVVFPSDILMIDIDKELNSQSNDKEKKNV